MKTLILNGSPKGKTGNSQIFIDRFVCGMQNPCDVRCIVREDYRALVKEMEQYEHILIVMPLYIHAMPGIVMKLFEQMEPCAGSGKSIGFILQAGFMESETAAYACRVLEAMVKRLNYAYLGTVSRCNAAGIYMMPEQVNRKLFRQLQELGQHYEQTGSFCPTIVKKLAHPYTLSKFSVWLYETPMLKLLNKVGWRSMLKKNGAYAKRLDRPFA